MTETSKYPNISQILKYIKNIKYINYKNQLYGSCDQKLMLWRRLGLEY